MHSTVTIPCADGTSRSCIGEKKYHLDYIGLSIDQLEEIEYQEGQAKIALSPEQMKFNNLTKSDVDYCNVEQRAWVSIDLDTTCSHCGSDR